MKTTPNFNFTPFPVLETERLVLRAPVASDDVPYFILRSNSDVNKYIGRKDYINIEQAQDFIARIQKNIAENDSVFWSMVLKETDEVIGTICLWNLSAENSTSEIGYEMHVPDFQGKRLMQEAVKSIIEYAFSAMKVDTIYGVPVGEHIKSVRLLESFGFTRDHEAEKMLPEDEIEILTCYVLKNPN